MAYDRYDRDKHSRWQDDRSGRDRDRDERSRGERGSGRGHEDRGFFERASEEISSWFGGGSDHDRHGDEHRSDRDRGSWRPERSNRDEDRGYGRDYERDRAQARQGQRHRQSDQDFNRDRGVFSRGGSSEEDYNRGWSRNLWGGGDHRPDLERDQERGRSGSGYRPMTGDYGRGDDRQERGPRGYGRDDNQRMREFHRESDRSEGPWSRDDYRRTSFAGSQKSDRDYDPNYRDWRERHMSEIDRDYHDYRREHQSRFEDDFSGWRDKRQEKRGLLSQIREQMDVVGGDGEHVGTVDKVAGDRIILTKSDPASGGGHHSIGCSAVDRVEGNRVVLDCSARDARNRWRDEDRSRALFERHDQGEEGPGALNRSFSGTYRDR